MHRRLALLAATILLLLTACEQRSNQSASQEIPFRPDGVLAFERPGGARITAIAIEIAEGDSAQARGLMQRRSLPKRGGMFFPYPKADKRGFWMANTYIPLDIIFVGPDSQIVDIARNMPPLSKETFHPSKPAQYVVEVRAGFATRHGLDTTAHIDWRREQ